MEGDPGLEVFVKNVPLQATEKTLATFLKPFMVKLSIRNYHCQKTRDKKFANITFLKRDDGSKFLRAHGHLEAPPPPRRRNNINNNGLVRTDARFNPRVKLNYLNHTLYPVISNRLPNKFLLKVLAKEEKESKTLPEVVRNGTERKEKPILPVLLGCSYVSCGAWNYATNGELVFMTEYTWPVNNYAKFGERRLLLDFESGLRMTIPYSSTTEILCQMDPPTITFTLHESPRFYRKVSRGVNMESLLEQLAGLNVQAGKASGHSWQRLTSLDGNHARIAGICLVYRFSLSESSSTIPGHINVVREKIQALRNARDIPPLVHYRTRVSQVDVSAATTFSDLLQALSLETIPFKLAFQLQKLAQNNYLAPSKVLRLLPEILLMLQRSELSVCVRAVRKLFSQIDFPGSGTEVWDFDTVNLIEMLQTNEEHNTTDNSFPEDHISQAAWENVAIIHRAIVTPAGTYLHGPEPETKNRVLRKYPNNHEYFLRVEFSDENGQQVYFDPQASLDEIFHVRFRDVLRGGLTIAGRNFQFLGFSHSSLRARTAWFMAPFYLDGNICSDRMVIKDLGDFSHIRSPAKCGARIGQAFSDTPNTIHIDSTIVYQLEDVQLNGRVFSDGVGTISSSVREKILDGMNRGKGRTNLATCFQIRYKGAKGMVALDSRIQGDVFALRPSMIKFEGSTDPDLELCGAARKPLPFKLNRQFIKILEDLQVNESFFFDLQAREVNRLRQITDDAYNATTFLKTQAIGDSMHLPALMRELIRLNIDFREDKFLRDILEMSILLELRDLKHRARIPVPNGHVLHGIMDETGLLEEGQVFVVADNENGVPTVIARKHIVVTRAPAMHPGDVQIVEAIIPPKDSPLMKLSNCICFSQKGQRDLPSQLSGGDLDGDLYHVMWDPAGLPKWTFPPAEYPRQKPVDLGRDVTREDMTDFFVEFMETDQLGRICINHMILADRKDQGTMDPGCIKLAELASIAVDFSKTGIPVDKTDIQRPDGPWRPDFMAPGPHVNIEKKDSISFNDPVQQREQADEDDDEENRLRYYESDKVLGKLYRAIDEYGIFKQIQERLTIEDGDSVRIDYGSEEPTVIPKVWGHVQRTCHGFQWGHHLEEARGIREIYENSLLNIISDYSEHPRRPISEKEAFIGNILGKTGAQTKQQRDLSSSMKEQFDRDAGFVVGCILKDVDGYSEEALERSVACLQVSLEEREASKHSEQLSSFKYLAASICLREIDRRFGGGWH